MDCKGLKGEELKKCQEKNKKKINTNLLTSFLKRLAISLKQTSLKEYFNKKYNVKNIRTIKYNIKYLNFYNYTEI